MRIASDFKVGDVWKKDRYHPVKIVAVGKETCIVNRLGSDGGWSGECLDLFSCFDSATLVERDGKPVEPPKPRPALAAGQVYAPPDGRGTWHSYCEHSGDGAWVFRPRHGELRACGKWGDTAPDWLGELVRDAPRPKIKMPPVPTCEDWISGAKHHYMDGYRQALADVRSGNPDFEVTP